MNPFQIKCPCCDVESFDILLHPGELESHYVACFKEKKKRVCSISNKKLLAKKKALGIVNPQGNPGETFMCDECGKTFTTAFCLLAHVDLHK